MFFPPLVEMIAFGYALDNDVKHMAMVVFNEDRTVESRQLLDRFVNTETFRIVKEVGNATANGERNPRRPRLCRDCKFLLISRATSALDGRRRHNF